MVFFFSEVDWGYLRQRHHFFAENYAKRGHRVLYIGRIGLRYPKLQEVFAYFVTRVENGPQNTCQLEGVELYGSTLLPPLNFLFNFINKQVGLKRLADSITTEEIIIHFYQPTALILDFIDICNERNIDVIVVYDCVQDYRHHPARTIDLIEIEKRLLSKCKLVIADSSVNFDRLSCSSDKILVPPGVDLDHFDLSKYKRKTLNKNDKIKLLYYGNIRKDLDIKIINSIGNSTNFDLTLVGLLNIDKSMLSSNVEVLKAVDYTCLPELIKDYDALLLPYNINNPFVKAIIPAKFFECLRTGLPILCTAMESIKDYHVYLNVVSIDTCFNSIKLDDLRCSYDDKIEILLQNSTWSSRFDSFYTGI